MLSYPNIDPVALSLGPLQVHWYGIMYLIGFGGAWFLAKLRAARPGSHWTSEQIADLIFYGTLGVVIGGRFGYVLFYKFDDFLENPLWLFYVWEGGMSFHGGFIGVLVALAFYARKINKPFVVVMDFIAPMVPVGLGTGRLGNFIGGELWGRVSDSPWAMVFPKDISQLPRHPSQLYQLALEGVILFTILWLYSAKPRPTFAVSGMFALCYGVFRFAVEFLREPDGHIGFVAFNWLTMGQLLSLPMIVAGLAILAWGHNKQSIIGKSK